MFLNIWGLALTVCCLMVLFLAATAFRSAVRVLRFWNPASDSQRQISLESEIWLSATLIQYALLFQIVSLCLYVLAADNFCQVIAGAMCATGALLANNFGVPELMIKLAGVFLYGFWIVLHRLDISADDYPLVKMKYVYFIILLPLLLADITCQTLYLAGLSPDIITSCCGVIFDTASGSSDRNLLDSAPQGILLAVFYGTVLFLIMTGVCLLRRFQRFWAAASLAGWLWFLGLATLTIISVFSSYIYAMPFHHCPFCIMKPEYNYLGFGLFGLLITAVFFGASAMIVSLLRLPDSLNAAITDYRLFCVRFSLVLLLLFTALASYHYLIYRIAGGEI